MNLTTFKTDMGKLQQRIESYLRSLTRYEQLAWGSIGLGIILIITSLFLF